MEQLGFRSTKLRTPEDSLLVLPNSMLAYGVLDNMGLRQHQQIRTTFGVTPGTPLDKIFPFRDQLSAYLHAYPVVDSKRVHVHVNRITEGGIIELEATAYFDAKDPEAERQYREDLTCETVRLAGVWVFS